MLFNIVSEWGYKMKRISMLIGLALFVIFLVGCNNENFKEQQTSYSVTENGKKTYYENYEFKKDIPNFDSTLRATIKSLNVIKDGKRDLAFVRGIESEDLEKDLEYQFFLKAIPGHSELKIKKAEIENYTIMGMEHNKDENLIKVFIEIKTKEEQNLSVIHVLNNQTYIFKIEKDTLRLAKYHHSQHLR
jgi:hypothetical protein